MTAREIVWDALSAVNEQGKLSHTALSDALGGGDLTAEDRAFAARLLHGTLERQQTIDTVIAAAAGRPVGKIKARVLELLRMSVYQLLFLSGVPASAACNEAVKLAKRRGLSGLSGFVNGVLRGIARHIDEAGGAREYLLSEAAKMPAKEAADFLYSMPSWITELWAREFPYADIKTMAEAFLTEGTVSVRLNESRASMEDLITSLAKDGANPVPGILQNVLRIRGGNPAAFSAYGEGWFSIQDESAVLAGNLLPLAPGMRVLDLCAAPGGKTVHAADRLTVLDRAAGESRSDIISRELKRNKLPAIEEALRRVGIDNVRAEAADAAEYDPALAGWADIVIADVPCSGLGVIGRKPDIKTKTRPEDIKTLAELQRRIVTQAVRYVKPGGYLAYSTCTVTRAENADMADYIADTLGMEPVDLREQLPAVLRDSEYQAEGLTARGIQILPEADRFDGFFIAGFRKPV